MNNGNKRQTFLFSKKAMLYLLAAANHSHFFINSSKLSEIFIYDHVSHYLHWKLNPCQHDFTKSKSTITSLVTDHDSIISLVGSVHAQYIRDFSVFSAC
jgi:hypothetical protein